LESVNASGARLEPEGIHCGQAVEKPEKSRKRKALKVAYLPNNCYLYTVKKDSNNGRKR